MKFRYWWFSHCKETLARLPKTELGDYIYFEDTQTNKLTPEFYEYACKKDGEKVEIYYKPDGTLDHTKGISAPTHVTQP